MASAIIEETMSETGQDLAAVVRAHLLCQRSRKPCVKRCKRCWPSSAQLRVEAAIRRHLDGEITLGRAAEVAGVTRWRFQELLALRVTLEARFRVPVLILGSLDGIEVGYRQLRRTVPLETQEVETPEGKLIIPTLEELIHIKAFLAYERNYTRDFVDFAELSCLLEPEQVVEVLSVLDEKFQWEKQPSVIVEVTKALLRPEPHDRETHGFETLRLLNPKLKTWDEVAAQCHEIGRLLSIRILGGKPDAAPQP